MEDWDWARGGSPGSRPRWLMTWLSSSYDNQPGWAGLDFVSLPSQLQRGKLHKLWEYIPCWHKTSSSWKSQKTSLPQLSRMMMLINQEQQFIIWVYMSRLFCRQEYKWVKILSRNSSWRFCWWNKFVLLVGIGLSCVTNWSGLVI